MKGKSKRRQPVKFSENYTWKRRIFQEDKRGAQYFIGRTNFLPAEGDANKYTDNRTSRDLLTLLFELMDGLSGEK